MTQNDPQRNHDAPEHLSSDTTDTPPLTVVLLAGLVVIGVDRLRLHDPIPIVGYVGILDN